MRQTISPLGAPRDPSLAPFGATPSHGGKIRAVWAQHLDEVRAAQRLRYQVFAHEMGARLDVPLSLAHPGHDVDLFDDYCEHLLVRDQDSREVVGTYRVLTPAQARRVGAPIPTPSSTSPDCAACASAWSNSGAVASTRSTATAA